MAGRVQPARPAVARRPVLRPARFIQRSKGGGQRRHLRRVALVGGIAGRLQIIQRRPRPQYGSHIQAARQGTHRADVGGQGSEGQRVGRAVIAAHPVKDEFGEDVRIRPGSPGHKAQPRPGSQPAQCHHKIVQLSLIGQGVRRRPCAINCLGSHPGRGR